MQKKQNPQTAISRRSFLRLSATLGAGVGLAACGAQPPATPQATTAPAAPAATAVPAPTSAPIPTAVPAATAVPASVSKFSEAPMLADLVSSGGLPKVDERLPKNPIVLDGQDGPGNFGGTLRRGYRGFSDRWGPTKLQNESLTWYNSDFSLRANIIESWEVNSDATAWTFQLREGMKWSDGSPFTTKDWKWWFESVLTHPTVTTAPGGSWVSGKAKNVMSASFPDDYTAVFTFKDPKPLFSYNVTRDQPFAPAEYMKMLHGDFSDKEQLLVEAKAAGFESWEQLFNDRNNWWTIERPSIAPWIPINAPTEEVFVMERNPYFWQVDSQGQQLPYFDKATHRLFETPDALNTRIIAGEVDFQARHVSIGDFTLFKENESKGGFKVVNGVTANHIAFQPNHTTKNDNLREFFQNRDVRIALSIAINRAEINDLVFNGTATPRQYSPLKSSPQYYEKLSNAHIAFDPDKANALLDAAGYDKKDADGFRLWKDGSGTLSFTIEGTAQAGSPDEDAVQTMVKYFGDVGIKATYKALERSLYTEHFNANEIEAAFWGGDRTLLPIVAPWIFLGSMVDRPWAAAWGLYYNNPKDPNAQPPPEGHFITKIWALMDQINAEADDTERTKLFNQILDIWAEEIPMIGVLGELPSPTIVKDGFMGFRGGFPNDDTTEDENLLNTQTYYWDDPSKHMG